MKLVVSAEVGGAFERICVALTEYSVQDEMELRCLREVERGIARLRG